MAIIVIAPIKLDRLSKTNWFSSNSSKFEFCWWIAIIEIRINETEMGNVDTNGETCFNFLININPIDLLNAIITAPITPQHYIP